MEQAKWEFECEAEIEWGMRVRGRGDSLGSLHQLLALGLGGEPLLGADEESAEFGQLFGAKFDQLRGEFP